MTEQSPQSGLNIFSNTNQVESSASVNSQPSQIFPSAPIQQNIFSFSPPAQNTQIPMQQQQYQIPIQQQQYQIPQQVPNLFQPAQQPQQLPNLFQQPQQAPNIFGQPQQLFQQPSLQFQTFPAPQQNYGFPANFNSYTMPPQATQNLRLLKAKDESKKIAAIIISFTNGCTYDNLFTSVQQKTLQGTQVLVYAAPANSIKEMYEGFTEKPTTDIVKELINNMKEVDADCVVFNWQCSSNYSSQMFSQGRDLLMSFLKLILDAGHMAMFSDFSLKALISQWDKAKLGQNPFVKTGETSNHVALHFKSSVLKECPSAQLQIIGEMAQGGKCNIHTLGGTILYSVDKSKIDNNAYELQILTVNITNVPENPQYHLEIDGHKGSAGHVLLKYKSKGQLLTSMGHWIELMKIDTSEQKLFEVAEKEYGKQYVAQMKAQYAQMDVQQQRSYVQSQAVNFVQNQAPCSNMNKKYY